MSQTLTPDDVLSAVEANALVEFLRDPKCMALPKCVIEIGAKNALEPNGPPWQIEIHEMQVGQSTCRSIGFNV